MKAILRALALPLAALLPTAITPAQITVRDTITPLPPISICQDGATHRTVCTNLRLRPGGLGSLTQFEGWPLEITGTPGAVTCQFVTVSSVTILTNEQFSMTTTTATTMSVDFFGSGPNGDVFLLFVAPVLQPTPTTFPPFLGPVHLDPTFTLFIGLFAPLGPNNPYHTISFPYDPAAIGIDFYDQCLAVHATATPETTVVDCFRF